jgi:hypothetical protein
MEEHAKQQLSDRLVSHANRHLWIGNAFGLIGCTSIAMSSFVLAGLSWALAILFDTTQYTDDNEDTDWCSGRVQES